jgi:ribonuclease T2
VAAATGSAPMLECNRNETQLYQVFQCVGLDGRTLVHCPPPEQRGCTDMVKFPPF